MSLPLPPPPPHVLSKAPLPNGKKEPEIVVIPEKFYGVALKLNTLTDAESQASQKPLPPPPPKPAPVVAPVPPMPRHPVLPIILVIVVVIAAVAGGFIYFNRDLLFKKTPPPTPVPIVVVPDAPRELIGSLSGLSAASLSWIAGSGNETGFRIQRKEGEGTYIPLTSLPAQSMTFLDTTPTLGRTFSYRIVAVNEGGESQPSNEVSVVIPEPAPIAPPPPTLPPGGLDSDSDGLSDAEELVFGTDPHNPDTDGDGFLDGNEAFHLYNPAAQAPVNLIDSGLVTQANSPSGWSLYLPTQWTATFEANEGPGAVLDTKHGERFEIRLESNPQRMPLLDWYLANHPGTVSSAVRSVTTKRGLEGILGPERLDAYFAWDDRIWVIKYNLNGQSFIGYRTIFELILNSLRLVGAPIVKTPTMDTLPGPGALVGDASSTTPVISETVSSPVPDETSTSSVASTSTTSTSTDGSSINTTSSQP